MEIPEKLYVWTHILYEIDPINNTTKLVRSYSNADTTGKTTTKKKETQKDRIKKKLSNSVHGKVVTI